MTTHTHTPDDDDTEGHVLSGGFERNANETADEDTKD